MLIILLVFEMHSVNHLNNKFVDRYLSINHNWYILL
jgi:hypothetical protein